MQKKFIKFLVCCLLLVALGVGILLFNLNPILNALKPKIEEQLSKAIRHPVSLGELSLRLVPSVAVQINNVTLAGTNGSETKIGKLLLKTSLLPLLHHSLEVSELEAVDLHAKITRNKAGQLVIGDLPLATPSDAPDESKDKKADDPKVETNIALKIAEAALQNGNITWQDEYVNPPALITLQNLNVVLQDISERGIDHFSISAGLLSNSPQNIQISGTFGKAPPSGSATKPFPLPGNMDGEIAVNEVNLEEIQKLLTSYGLVLPGASLSDTFSFHSKLKANNSGIGIEADLDATNASILLPGMVHKVKSVPFKLTIAGEPNLSGISLTKCDLLVNDSVIHLPLSYDLLTQSTQLSLDTQKFSLKSLSALVSKLQELDLSGALSAKLQYSQGNQADPRTEGNLELVDVGLQLPLGGDTPLTLSNLNGKITAEQDAIIIKPLSFLLAQQKFELGSKISPIKPSQFGLQAALKAETLQLEPVLKSFIKGDNPALKNSSFDGLTLTLQYSKQGTQNTATLGFAKGLVNGISFGATKLTSHFTLSTSNTLVQASLDPSTLQAFGGTLNVQGTLNEEKRANFNLQGSKLDLKQMSDLQGPGKISVTGLLDSLSIQGQTLTSNAAGALSANIRALASSGTIEGFNFVGQTLGKINQIPALGAALSAYIPEKYQPILQANSTAFDKLSVEASVKGKSILLSRLALEHSLYIITGDGEIAENGDLHLKTQLRLTPIFARGMVAREAKLKLLLDKDENIVIPVVLTRKGGTFLVLPDATELGKRALGNTAKEAAGRALDKVAPGLGGALQGLFQ